MEAHACDRCGEILLKYPDRRIKDESYDLCKVCSGIHRAHVERIEKMNEEFFKDWILIKQNEEK